MRAAILVICIALAAPRPASACAGGGYPTGKACGATVSFEGCCDGSTLTWCEGGQVCVKNCAENPGNSCCEWSPKGGCCDVALMSQVCAAKPECCSTSWNGGCIAYAQVILDYQCPPCPNAYTQCGWDVPKKFYNCATSASPDPSGTHPLACGGTTCAPACGVKQCGDDGCGGACGFCGAGYTCGAGGVCEAPACAPKCAGAQCGDDGCGGSCGACDAWEACTEGQCVLKPTCTPSCAGKTCGDDGCQGSCGTCDPWEVCGAGGQCAQKPAACAPECGLKVCGDDGCGGSCGACAGGQTCSAGGVCEGEPGFVPAGHCPPGTIPSYKGCTTEKVTGKIDDANNDSKGRAAACAAGSGSGGGAWLTLLGLACLAAGRRAVTLTGAEVRR